MNVRTYQAPTMAEALAAVKRELGRDAVIVHTRSLRKGGFLGFLGGKSIWEITAAPNLNVPRRAPRGTYVAATPADAAAATTAVAEPARKPAMEVGREVREIRDMVAELLSRQGDGLADAPAALRQLHDRLRQQDVSEAVAAELAQQLRRDLTGEQLHDEEFLRERLAGLVAAKIPTADAGCAPGAKGGRVIALIGPTGVGKTTTIAKLAANFKLREGRSVGLITIDTYRIAAVDQLKTYAEIIDIPLRVVLTAGELQQAVAAMRGLDVLLIDTAGRSQNDATRLDQLRGFLQAAEPDDVHLVISATSNNRCACRTLEKFLPLGAGKLIITKLDEAATFGTILNAAVIGRVPISYVTTGQDVPEDISAADAGRLARCIIGGTLYVS